MAVQHIRIVHSNINLDTYSCGNYKPSLLSDTETKNLVTANTDGFLFVVDSARGRILFVSESVSNSLNFLPQELTGQSVFDILHPKDVSKVKEQLTSVATVSPPPRDRLIDSKTMLPLEAELAVSPPITRLQPGARRVFLCRMKCKQVENILITIRLILISITSDFSDLKTGGRTFDSEQSGSTRLKKAEAGKLYQEVHLYPVHRLPQVMAPDKGGPGPRNIR